MERMRLFRRAQDTKTSVVRREAGTAGGDVVDMRVPTAPVAPSSRPCVLHSVDPSSEPSVESASVPVYDGFEDSDVFLCENQERPAAVPTIREVTLFVHGWYQVEPGLLSWTFQDLRSALDAVQRMKNAIAWCIVQGTGWDDLAIARASGKILVEQVA